MLTRLTIQNYALISRVEIDFREGLSIITGETGAGKSIMLGALMLLLGARADTRVLRSKEEKTMVEASFVPRAALRTLLEQNNLDWDERELIVRREISPSGRSRAFINDTPVNLKLLAEVVTGLIDIHSQNSNVMLSERRRQLEIIDALASNAAEREAYRKCFRSYVALRSKLRDLRTEISQRRENENFIRFQLSQLDELSPKPGELARLENEAEILSDAEDIRGGIAEAVELVEAPDDGLIARMAKMRHTLSKINFSLLEREGDAGLLQRLESVYVELKDISRTLDGTLESVDADPARLEKVQQRINELYEAQQRFKVATDTELVELHAQLRRQLQGLDGSEEDISGMERELKGLGKELKEAADRLSESRVKAAELFSAALVEQVRPLGMPNLKFSAMLTKGKLSADGQDDVSFLCAFNKNQELQPVAGYASGGETSRLMLGIKAVIASRVNLPSIIFDEVDTGVSGEVADRMGTMMKQMGERMQVIAITHLPQVAAKGKYHFKVYKSDDEEKTVTNISLLDEEGRERELAQMLSGSEVDEAALLNARSLLRN